MPQLPPPPLPPTRRKWFEEFDQDRQREVDNAELKRTSDLLVHFKMSGGLDDGRTPLHAVVSMCIDRCNLTQAALATQVTNPLGLDPIAALGMHKVGVSDLHNNLIVAIGQLSKQSIQTNYLAKELSEQLLNLMAEVFRLRQNFNTLRELVFDIRQELYAEVNKVHSHLPPRQGGQNW